MHEATAINWNGKVISVTFTARTKDVQALISKAHDAFHRDGKWTIELRSVDGIEVAAEFRYKA